MKVHHAIERAINSPQPTKVYGARVVDLRLNGSSVTVVWAIFGRKNRKRKAARKPTVAKGE